MENGLRFELDMFAKAMETKLKKHDGDWGDSWKTCERTILRDKLFDEIQEFARSYKSSSEYDRKELIDIANMCMMLWFRDWALVGKGTSFDLSSEVGF